MNWLLDFNKNESEVNQRHQESKLNSQPVLCLSVLTDDLYLQPSTPDESFSCFFTSQ